MKVLKFATISSMLMLLAQMTEAQVSVFEHNNYEGKSHTYTEGEHHLTPTIGDNVLSSVKVSPGWKVTLQEHGPGRADRGKSIVLTEDMATLSSKNFNDMASTIIVERVGGNQQQSKNTLNSGETLGAGSRLTAANGKFILRMQEDDGHLCVYKFENGQQGAFVWGSGKHGFKNAKLVMQSDGNLVVSAGNTPKWASDTHPHLNAAFKDASKKPVKLVLENDGKLNLYNASGSVVWSN